MLDYWPSPLPSVDRAVVMVEQAIMAMITGVNDQGVEEIRCDCFELLCGSRVGFSWKRKGETPVSDRLILLRCLSATPYYC